MTLLYRDDAYARTAEATVLSSAPGDIRLDRTLFYPTGGGQPGDTGVLRWGDGRTTRITDSRKAAESPETGDGIIHVPADDGPLPPPGTRVTLEIDWDRRFRHMRMHTALHLLCAVVDGAVTGGQVGEDRSRLDFDVPGAALDKADLQRRLTLLVEADHPVHDMHITGQELAEQPELVRTLSVKPPVGGGRVRLLRIGAGDCPVDMQPCGGTHVGHTGEIGGIEVVKIENKGRQNRRVVIALRD